MKRFTETDKWRDAQYLSFSPTAKAMLGYIYDNCDEAGFIDVITAKWAQEIKIATQDQFTAALAELQPVLLSNKAEKKLWLTVFLRQEQKLPLNSKVPADKYIIEKLTRQLPKFGNPPQIAEILMVTQAKSKSGKKAKPTVNFVPPTVEDFKAYFKENGYPEQLAVNAWKGYNTPNDAGVNWVDSGGKPIKNWKQKCQHVWFKEKNKHDTAKTNSGDKGRHSVASNF